MSALLRELVWDNPMLSEATRVGRRFLRSGGETGKAVNYVILGLIAFMYFWLLLVIVRFREDMTLGLLLFELTLLTLVVPASIYGAISGERERATWEGLILTRLTPAQIIAGKILLRILIIGVIVLLMSLPIALSQMVGRYSRDLTGLALLRGQATIFCWAVFLSAFGLWVSANTRRSVTTIAVLSGSLLATLLLLPILLSIFGVQLDYIRAGNPFDRIGSFFVHLNPFFALSQLGESQGRRQYGGYGAEYPAFAPFLLFVLPLVYLGAALFLIRLTHRSLRRLEAPQSR